MSPYSDSNPDKVSGFGWPHGVEIGNPDNNPDKVSGFNVGYRRETQIATCGRGGHLKNAEELATEMT